MQPKPLSQVIKRLPGIALYLLACFGRPSTQANLLFATVFDLYENQFFTPAHGLAALHLARAGLGTRHF